MNTFAIRWIVGPRPDHIAGHVVAMVAPRPLWGTQTSLHPEWGWAGQVVVDPDDVDAIEHNRRMDAAAVRWITHDDIIKEMTEWVTHEYGADALDGLTGDDLVGMWESRHWGDRSPLHAIVVAYTDRSDIAPTGRMVQRDLNWFPEMTPVETPRSVMWLNAGFDADVAAAERAMVSKPPGERWAVYALPLGHPDPLGEAKTRIMREGQ